MSGNQYIITSGAVQKTMLEHIARMRIANKVPVVTVEEQGVKRSIPQNDLFYALYCNIAKQMEGETPKTIRREAKLILGVPILRAEDEEFRHFYDKAVKHTLAYDEKLTAMDFVPVTSRMNKKQGSQYIDEVIRRYSEQGIRIIASEYV